MKISYQILFLKLIINFETLYYNEKEVIQNSFLYEFTKPVDIKDISLENLELDSCAKIRNETRGILEGFVPYNLVRICYDGRNYGLYQEGFYPSRFYLLELIDSSLIRQYNQNLLQLEFNCTNKIEYYKPFPSVKKISHTVNILSKKDNYSKVLETI